MEQAKISVVVPAYNTAQWLPRCLDSILAQTYENLEVIVVDDGSVDDTPRVLREYAHRDSRIVPIIQKNGGETAARLRGVAEATGEWIGFVDSDDEIEPEMYERLLGNALKYNADISNCGHQMVYADGERVYYYNTGLLKEQEHFTALRDLLEEKIMEPGVCNKLYKRRLFEGVEKQMDYSIKNNCDLLLNYYLFTKSQKAVLEDVCPYHYRILQTSVSNRKSNLNRIYDPIQVKKIILGICPEELKEDVRRAMVETCLFSYAQLTRDRSGEYHIHRENVRNEIKAQKPYRKLLPLRSVLLVYIISDAPWIFHLVYGVYYRFKKKKQLF